MKHAIGWDRKLVKRGKYVPYRNYFNKGDERCPEWDSLIEQGFAGEFKRFGQIIYYVNETGREALSSILEVKIEEQSK
jgi:hypothetical protein